MKRFAIFLPLVLALLGACTEDPVQPEKGVVVTGHNLPPSGSDFHYKLWFSYPLEEAIRKDPRIDHEESAYFAVGSFRVDQTGAITGLGGAAATFLIPEGYSPNLISDALVTIELNGAVDTIPGPIVLAGDFVGSASLGVDTLTLTGRHAFGVPMEKILEPDTTNRYFLNTPTTADQSDYANGIWFVTLEDARFQPSLILPAQPINQENARWEYESWLIDNRVAPGAAGRYISLGRFDSPARKDQNGAGPGAGSDPSMAYDAPGEDFTTPPARALTSGAYGVVVSLQPFGLSLDHPFITLMKRDTIPAGLGLFQPDSLAIAVDRPTLEVRLDR
jgi:hypothetical protein